MILLALLVLPLLAQGEIIHGADSIFSSPEVSVVWGVLRGPTEAETLVVMRIGNPAARFSHLRVEGVDPFTGRRAAVVEGMPLGALADVTTPRSRFADLPRRDILLYTSEADWLARKPMLSVYYLGVPDTTPEFSSRAALDAYLARMQPRER